MQNTAEPHPEQTDPTALARYKKRSDLAWVRPLVPEINEDVPCSLSTGKREELQWVARYYVALPSSLTEQTDRVYAQKTRTASLKAHGSSHSAFLAALNWLWTKHELCSGCERPKHVVNILQAVSCHDPTNPNFERCEAEMTKLARTCAELKPQAVATPGPQLPKPKEAQTLQQAEATQQLPRERTAGTAALHPSVPDKQSRRGNQKASEGQQVELRARPNQEATADGSQMRTGAADAGRGRCV